MRVEAITTMALALGIAVGGCDRTRMGRGEEPDAGHMGSDGGDMGPDAGDVAGHDHPAAGMGPGLQSAPPFRAEAVPTTDGARLELHAEDSQRVRDLRTHVAEHVKMMAAGRCPMMEQQPGEATGESPTP